MHDEAMRWTVMRWTMGRCFGAMRFTMRRCDARLGDAMDDEAMRWTMWRCGNIAPSHRRIVHRVIYYLKRQCEPSRPLYFLRLLMPSLIGASSSSDTWYCQVHHSAGDVVPVTSLDVSRPTKTVTEHYLVDR